jgi:two-component system response regulator NreC
MQNNPIRVLIADDNALVRRGVADILASSLNCEVCGEAGDGGEAVEKAKDLSPDLVLLDISMPGMNGLEPARLLRQRMGSCKILIMSQHDPVQLLPRAIEAGAHGCVDKSRLNFDLLQAIHDLQ